MNLDEIWHFFCKISIKTTKTSIVELSELKKNQFYTIFRNFDCSVYQQKVAHSILKWFLFLITFDTKLLKDFNVQSLSKILKL